MEESEKNSIHSEEEKKSAPYIIKGVLFFIILTSSLAVIFYSYLFFWNPLLINSSPDLVLNPWIGQKTYLILEFIIFVFLIFSSLVTIKLKRWGSILLIINLTLLFVLNSLYFREFDAIYTMIFIIILLIIGFYLKKFN